MENCRTFVIGDIHGCSRALKILIDRMALTPGDRVVVLGDAVDRGPDTQQVLNAFIEIRAICEFIYIFGNHEEMMLDAIRGKNVETWMRHGGSETRDAYGGDLRQIPESHLELLNSTVPFWEGPTAICIHANLEPGVELEKQRPAWLRWHKLSGREFPHPSGKRVICGHTPVRYGIPSVRNGWVCLDTEAFDGGYLSAVNLVSGEILQSRQNGEFRSGVFLHELEA